MCVILDSTYYYYNYTGVAKDVSCFLSFLPYLNSCLFHCVTKATSFFFFFFRDIHGCVKSNANVYRWTMFSSLVPRPRGRPGYKARCSVTDSRLCSLTDSWLSGSLVPRPPPSFPSLAVREAGRGPGNEASYQLLHALLTATVQNI